MLKSQFSLHEILQSLQGVITKKTRRWYILKKKNHHFTRQGTFRHRRLNTSHLISVTTQLQKNSPPPYFSRGQLNAVVPFTASDWCCLSLCAHLLGNVEIFTREHWTKKIEQTPLLKQQIWNAPSPELGMEHPTRWRFLTRLQINAKKTRCIFRAVKWRLSS